ncbi:hypothetical protein J4E05_05695 [Thalassospira sp. NFXS8]|uniref:DUF6196 family protein n=1 Tax=Thalassospira sp. NFXS8 TaxID=2819093 RepID=UPI0032DF0C63
MVNISQETPEQTDTRLRQVMVQTQFKAYAEPYIFDEFPITEFSARIRKDALAIVRDDDVWSQLVPAKDDRGEQFQIFRLHFPAGADNSGFVGWLANHLKHKYGTGVFVVCGQNSAQGGIFDYWGYPAELANDILAELASLRNQVKTD